MSEYISWSETALETQEERLAVDAKSAQLQIGLPKEHAMNEHRLLLTPESVQILVAQGHEIVVESGAGTLAGFPDALYANAGATIALGPEEVFQCAIIAKVAPPTVNEISMMRGGQTLISALQLRTRNRDYFKSLADKKITALALEEVRNSEDQSALRMAMSEIAGQMAARVGASLLADGAHGSRKGKLMGPIPGVAPARVVVLGAGVAGLSAVRAAHGMGSQVVLMDSNINRLRAAQELNPALITEVIQDLVVAKRLKKADKKNFAELFTDPRVLELIPQKAFTENQITERFDKNLNLNLNDLSNQKYACGIFEKGNAELIGLALFLINENDEKDNIKPNIC